MLVDIGRLVLSESCHQMVAWRNRFGNDAPRVMCVNVSCRQFAQADLIAEIQSILKDTGLESSSLHLEITESAFIGDVRAANTTLNRLQSLGVEWSIDDFGTGYSSLSYLHRLQAGTVKIDRSFVSRVGHGDRGAEMVSAIVGLAHSFGMDVVAEGVETAEQLGCVRRLGCDYVQGFYFSKAIEAAAVEALIAAQPWRALVTGDSTDAAPILSDVVN
jgi:EAL domain-containing protein (putative c-di-GMP-specific phosphodiesterase class I)